MAKLTTAEFIEAIKELTVLELNDLVKACEEEFGVSAAAGAVVMAVGDGAAAQADEKDEFDVEPKYLLSRITVHFCQPADRTIQTVPALYLPD